MLGEPIDEAMRRARAAASPAIDPVADRILARVRQSLVGVASEPTKLGRYTIVESLGKGGMGTVFGAYDPVLDRKVALKLVRTSDESGRDRVLGEARALARLAHPNVVAVHDVGAVDEVVYIAMELVAGANLRTFAESHAGAYRDVVRAYVEAGRGLAAAHAAGIVHGDVKPDNLVIGRDGRTRVIDFGLARSVDAAEANAPRGGTPAYMAPEQLTGEPADARSDQFAFCASLYEALYGERPFTGTSIAELAVGRIRPAPAGARVPLWLRRVVVRGLDREPERRYPSMDALVAALVADVRARRRRWLIGAGVLGIGALAGLLLAPASANEVAPCDAEERLGDAWTADRRDAVAASLAAVKLAHVPILARLDAYAWEWKAGYTEACHATRVRAEQSPLLLDLRVHCLEQGRAALGSLAATLAARPDAATVELAADAVWQLPDLAACADSQTLLSGVPLPPPGPARAELDELDQAVARVRTELDTGKRREALADADTLRARITDATYPATRTAVLDVAGDAHHWVGDFETEERLRREQVKAASASRDGREIGNAWLMLAECLAENPARLAAANEVIDAAEAEAARTGAHDLFVARLATFRGNRLRDADDERGALAQYQRALARRERVQGPNHPDVAASLTNIAGVYLQLGKPKDALVAGERALAIRERALGPDHPETAVALSNLGNAAHALGDHPRARRLFERAITLLERRLGRDDFQLAYALKGLGDTLISQRDPRAAVGYFERALAIFEASAHAAPSREVGVLRVSLGQALAAIGKLDDARATYERALGDLRAAYGPDHKYVLACLNNLANLLAARGDLAAARTYQEQVLAIFERTAPKHPNAGVAAMNLAETYRELGMHERARPLYERAVAIQTAALGPDHPDVALALASLGHAALVRGDSASARTAFERALPILAKDGDPPVLGYVQFGLAQTVWSTDPRRARELADRAVVTLTAAGPDGASDLRDLARWRATH